MLLLTVAAACSKDRRPDLSFFGALPATTTALAICERPADCRMTALWRRFQPTAAAITLIGAGPVVLFQNEYSPALLLPAGAAAATAGEARTHRGQTYTLTANLTARKAGTPADKESWAVYRLPGSGQTMVGGEAAITDVIDVAAGAKPALIAVRAELHPLLGRFGATGSAAIEYSFTAQAQQQGVEGGLDAILGSWPVRTVLGPVTSYRGRAARFERDGARCRLSYGIQLASGIAARGLHGAIYTAMSAGTFAGWPLGPEYLSSWRAERAGELVILTAGLTKAGCEYWQKE